MTEGNRKVEQPGDQDLTAIALIRKPIGLKGWFAVAVFGQTLERLECPVPVMVGVSRKTAKSRVLVGVHRDPKGYRCRLAECPDRNAAEALRERTIFLHTDRLPSLDKGEFYHFELEGMEVVGVEGGRALGTVIAVHNYPTTDALEVELRDGGTVLVPMAGDIIVEIMREERRVMVRAVMLEELL
ncbi:MAG: 16S rRNA processing protein RimM [Chitinivibrionales bacterium]|nr:16S rRNA processing protein RimM [Chitinivibrionales bacterium]MBD3356950.1 16S rRNA processing protein RimM [Chitinivibrionales bacterium]